MAEAELLAAGTALERHADEWRRLAEQRSNAFLTPEWFDCWRRHYGESATVQVAVARSDGGEIAGFMPLVSDREGGLRLTRFAGANLADLLGPVSAPEDEADVASAAVLALADGQGRSLRGAIVLDNIDGAASWWQEMAAAAGLRASERGRSVGPVAELAGGDYEAYLQRRSASFRKRLRRIERKIEREASIEMRMLNGPDEVEAGIATLFDLHDRRWEGRGGSSLTSPAARAFHLDFARAAAARGWLRLWLFEDAGKAVAAFYGWRLGDRYAYYQSGFEPDYARLSIGQFLHAKVIEQAVSEGAGEYDMLLGDEGYKATFTDEVRDLRTVVLSRRLSREGIAIGAEIGARKLLRRLPPSIRSRARERLAALNARLPTGRRR